jgi:hypothetical protein
MTIPIADDGQSNGLAVHETLSRLEPEVELHDNGPNQNGLDTDEQPRGVNGTSESSAISRGGRPAVFDRSSDSKTRTRTKNVFKLAENLTTVQQRILDNRTTQYDRVVPISIYWEDGDYPDMKMNAEAMHNVLQQRYRFSEAELFPLERTFKYPERPLQNKMNVLVQDFDEDKNNLVIVYYCGHGIFNEEGALLWKPRLKTKRSLDWNFVRIGLGGAHCDWLFILDCCYAGRMVVKEGVAQPWKRSCEVLGSVSALDEANADVNRSYTSRLCQLMTEKAVEGGIRVDDLHYTISDPDTVGDHLDRVPHHRLVAGPHSIFLKPSPAPETENLVPTDETPPTRNVNHYLNHSMIMVVAHWLDDLITEQPLDQTSWETTLAKAPREVSRADYIPMSQAEYEEFRNLFANRIRLQSVNKGSCLLIIAMPLCVWDCLADDGGYQAIGWVRSYNLMRPAIDDGSVVVSKDAVANKSNVAGPAQIATSRKMDWTRLKDRVASLAKSKDTVTLPDATTSDSKKIKGKEEQQQSGDKCKEATPANPVVPILPDTTPNVWSTGLSNTTTLGPTPLMPAVESMFVQDSGLRAPPSFANVEASSKIHNDAVPDPLEQYFKSPMYTPGASRPSWQTPRKKLFSGIGPQNRDGGGQEEFTQRIKAKYGNVNIPARFGRSDLEGPRVSVGGR